jgi:hypothetical protein
LPTSSASYSNSASPLDDGVLVGKPRQRVLSNIAVERSSGSRCSPAAGDRERSADSENQCNDSIGPWQGRHESYLKRR